MKLSIKDYAYILILVLLLNSCIFSYREYAGYNCMVKGGGIHPKCSQSSPVYQRMNRGRVYK